MLEVNGRNMENWGYTSEELLPIVAQLAKEYGGYEHSSLSYEKARMLMEAVIYCIREGEDGKEGILAKRPDVKEAYLYGRQVVTDKVRRLQTLYNELILDFRDYGSVCLRESIVEGIPGFLMHYDVKYAPQETLLLLDYPVLANLDAVSGIHAVLEYVESIALEQRFLKRFGDTYVLKVLHAYSADYGELTENICNIILCNGIGHMILRKPMDDGGFDREEYEWLENILEIKSEEGMERYLSDMLTLLMKQNFAEDEELSAYLYRAVADLAKRVQTNLENHCLHRIFFY